jgi:hypothetical protein
MPIAFHFVWLLLFMQLFGVASVFAAPGSGKNSSAQFVIDMVHNNPGEPLQATSFRDPRKLADWGYNGQGIMAEADSSETFDAVAPGIVPQGSEARIWIVEQAWTALLYGTEGDLSKNYNCKKLSPAIAEYDKLWAQWRTLLAAHPDTCTTICKDKAFQDKPGIGAGG